MSCFSIELFYTTVASIHCPVFKKQEIVQKSSHLLVVKWLLLFFLLHVCQDWALGVLHAKIIAAITLMGPQWWLKTVIEQVSLTIV